MEKNESDFEAFVALVTKKYIAECGSAYKVNCGACEDFANEIVEKFPEAEAVSAEQVGADEGGCLILNGVELDFFGHVWVWYKDKHYDAEAPQGVLDWKDLPIFKRRILRVFNCDKCITKHKASQSFFG